MVNKNHSLVTISVCLDEEIIKIVDEEHKRNGFDINEFVNTSLKKRFKIGSGKSLP